MDMMQDLHLETKNGLRLCNISVHEDRVIVDIRRRFAADDWEPFAELVLSLHQFRRLVHWLVECDLMLESHD